MQQNYSLAKSAMVLVKLGDIGGICISETPSSCSCPRIERVKAGFCSIVVHALVLEGLNLGSVV